MLRAVGLHSGATVVIPSQVATIGAMSVACEYPNCRAIATTIIVIELGRLLRTQLGRAARVQHARRAGPGDREAA